MLAWVLILMIGGFLLGCATVITTSCYQLYRLFRVIPGEKRVPMTRVIEV